MKVTTPQRNLETTPSVGAMVVFRGKASMLQLRRLMRGVLDRDVERFSVGEVLADKDIVGESETRLWTMCESEEAILVAGKIQNLRLAASKLNGVEVPAGRVFSFWKQLGRTSRLKGYVSGRELRQGCFIPSIGGGLCQLSNALYDTALRANFEIVERHAHTRIVPDSLAEIGRDATVFWNYVDLRFKSANAFRIEVELTADSLIVRFRSDLAHKHPRLVLPPGIGRKIRGTDQVSSCLSCKEEGCFRYVKERPNRTSFGRTAFQVDEYWPEFDEYIRETKHQQDFLCLPLDGKRFGKPNYAWTTDGFGAVKETRFFSLGRSYQSRKVVSQGAARQTALLVASQKLAHRYSSFLTYDVTHVSLMQNLLPFLWRTGCLGGRTFDVLMTSLPLEILHERLDYAFRLHPESQTLADFRAEEWLVKAESEALKRARRIITPHTQIAALYPDRTVLIDWTLPLAKDPVNKIRSVPRRLIFPATTVGRKGAYELREAVDGLDVELLPLGPILESKDFWKGMNVTRAVNKEDWLEDADAVVLPAFVEHKPRKLLEAIARGVPVITTTACGLEGVRGVTNVDAGDVESLREAIQLALRTFEMKFESYPENARRAVMIPHFNDQSARPSASINRHSR